MHHTVTVGDILLVLGLLGLLVAAGIIFLWFMASMMSDR